jgi:PAS domain-containing protein
VLIARYRVFGRSSLSVWVVGEAVSIAMWILVVVHGFIAGCGVWLLRCKCGRSLAHCLREAQRWRALLEWLSIVTHSGGIYCWEFDWNTRGVTFDASALAASNVGTVASGAAGVEIASRYKWVRPEVQEAARRVILQALARGERQCSFRYWLALADQSVRHVEAFVETDFDRDGRLCRFLGVSWDITEEVEAAERAARDASVQRELLEWLSVVTKVAGLQCFEFDWRTRKLAWVGHDQKAGCSVRAAQKLGEAHLASVIPKDLERTKEMLTAAMARRERTAAKGHRGSGS